MSLFRRLTRFSCHHRWSLPNVSRWSINEPAYSEWFCLDCGTRRAARVI